MSNAIAQAFQAVSDPSVDLAGPLVNHLPAQGPVLICGELLNARLFPGRGQSGELSVTCKQIENTLEVHVLGAEYRSQISNEIVVASGLPVAVAWCKGRLKVALYDFNDVPAASFSLTTGYLPCAVAEIYQQCAIPRYQWLAMSARKHVGSALVDDVHGKPDLPYRVHVGRQSASIEVAGYGVICRLAHVGDCLKVGVYSGDRLVLSKNYTEFVGPARKRRRAALTPPEMAGISQA